MALKHLNKLALAVSLTLTTTACVSSLGGQQGPTAAERLDQVLGQSERTIIDRWGRPDEVYDYADGAKDLTWEYSYWNEAWQEQWYCAITLEVDPFGDIVDWAYEYDYDAANPCHDIMDGYT